MNHSIYTVDRATHMKIVVAALLASIAIMATTVGLRVAHSDANGQAMATQTVYKPHPNHTLTDLLEKHPI